LGFLSIKTLPFLSLRGCLPENIASRELPETVYKTDL
jgi:hypothetical protein